MSMGAGTRASPRLTGRYRDRLIDRNGRLIDDRGWRPNLIVDQARVLIAALLKNEPAIGGLLYWAIGTGDPAWDGRLIEPDAGRSTLVDEAARQALAEADIRFIDMDGRPSRMPTDQLEVRAVFDGDRLAAAGVLSLREFGVFGGDATASAATGYLLDHVIHPRIDLTTGLSLERSLRLAFVEVSHIEPTHTVLGADLPARAIDGIGAVYARRLADSGIDTIGQMANLPAHPAPAGVTDYKHTLNLPKTGFPMKANLAQREPEMLKRWQAADIYGQIRAARAGGETFILHDGPPYANGDIHIGHAVNKVLKDIIVKSRTLDGWTRPMCRAGTATACPSSCRWRRRRASRGRRSRRPSSARPAATTPAARWTASARLQAPGRARRLGAALPDHGLPLRGRHRPRARADHRARPPAQGLQAGALVHRLRLGPGRGRGGVRGQGVRRPSMCASAVLDAEALFGRCHSVPEDHGEGPLSVVIWTTTPGPCRPTRPSR
jgi:hypothetical protein